MRDKNKKSNYNKKWALEHPWSKHYSYARKRCKEGGRYYGRIRFNMTTKDFKKLWFRDKAYEMDYPSIDRIDNDKDYVYENCRFLEYRENSRRGALVLSKKLSKPVANFINGKIVKKWKSIAEATKYYNASTGHISQATRGIRKTAHGFTWKLLEDL